MRGTVAKRLRKLAKMQAEKFGVPQDWKKAYKKTKLLYKQMKQGL